MSETDFGWDAPKSTRKSTAGNSMKNLFAKPMRKLEMLWRRRITANCTTLLERFVVFVVSVGVQWIVWIEK